MAVLDVSPIRFTPDRIDDFAHHLQPSSRRVKQPDPLSFLQHLLRAGRHRRLVDELSILKEVDSVRADIDSDQRAGAWCFGWKTFDVLLFIAVTELPPVA